MLNTSHPSNSSIPHLGFGPSSDSTPQASLNDSFTNHDLSGARIHRTGRSTAMEEAFDSGWTGAYMNQGFLRAGYAGTGILNTEMFDDRHHSQGDRRVDQTEDGILNAEMFGNNCRYEGISELGHEEGQMGNEILSTDMFDDNNRSGRFHRKERVPFGMVIPDAGEKDEVNVKCAGEKEGRKKGAGRRRGDEEDEEKSNKSRGRPRIDIKDETAADVSWDD